MVENNVSVRLPNLSSDSRDSTFDLLTPKVDLFMPCPVDHLCQFASKSVHSYSKYCVHKFGDERTNGRTDGQTDRQKT